MAMQNIINESNTKKYPRWSRIKPRWCNAIVILCFINKINLIWWKHTFVTYRNYLNYACSTNEYGYHHIPRDSPLANNASLSRAWDAKRTTLWFYFLLWIPHISLQFPWSHVISSSRSMQLNRKGHLNCWELLEIPYGNSSPSASYELCWGTNEHLNAERHAKMHL